MDRHKRAKKMSKAGLGPTIRSSARDATPQKTDFKCIVKLRGIVSAAQVKTKQIAAKLPCLMRSLA